MKNLFVNKTGGKKGFTLIETFIAISILMVVIVGPLTLSQRSLSSAKYARDRITAYYLAEDAIEYIRHLRDDAYYTQVGQTSINWAASNFLTIINPCYSGTVAQKWCMFDSQLDPVTTFDSDSARSVTNMRPCIINQANKCDPFNFNNSTQTFTYKKRDTDENCAKLNNSAYTCSTPFTRSVSISNSILANGNKELVVTVEVRWKSGLFGENDERNLYRVQEFLLDWQNI